MGDRVDIPSMCMFMQEEIETNDVLFAVERL